MKKGQMVRVSKKAVERKFKELKSPDRQDQFEVEVDAASEATDLIYGLVAGQGYGRNEIVVSFTARDYAYGKGWSFLIEDVTEA